MKSTTSEDSRKTLAARAPWESEVQGESGRPRVAPRKRQSGAPRKRDGERAGPGARGAVPRRPELSVGCACRGRTVGEHATAVWG